MGEDGFHIELANWDADGDALRAVREQVFVVEQHVPADEEGDALDADAIHVIARDGDGRAIGTARLTTTRAIGRMAVLEAWRGKGVGAALLRTLVEQARARGWPEVELHAQTHALAFYAQAGFVAEGPEFDECGIAHRRMRLAIAAFTPPPPRAPEARPAVKTLQSSNLEEALAATLAILADARYELVVQTRDLDSGLLDDGAVIDAFKRVALSGRRARIRILVQEPRMAISEGHALLRLAQQLPSAIAVRVPTEERDLGEPSAILLNDRGGFLLRPLASRMDGEGNTCAPGRHRQLLAGFDELWERAEPCADLRVLGI